MREKFKCSNCNRINIINYGAVGNESFFDKSCSCKWNYLREKKGVDEKWDSIL
jgi:hypothetical protein